MRINDSRHKGLSKEDFHEARKVYRALRQDGLSRPVKTRRRSDAFRQATRDAQRAGRSAERVAFHRNRARAYAALPVCFDLSGRNRTDGKGRGRSVWQGRFGTLVG